MATQRYISTSFWDDEWVQTLDPSEKLLYLYYMTNPLTNIAGVYKIGVRRISFDTGFNADTIGHIMKKFETAGKVRRIGEYIVIPTWPKHQKWEVKAKIKTGIDAILSELPEDVLSFCREIGYAYPIDSLCIPYTYPTNYSDSDSDSDSDIDTDIDSDPTPTTHKKRTPKPKPPKQKYGPLQNVYMTEDQYKGLYKDFGPWILEEYIKKVSFWKPNTKIPCYDDHARIRKWLDKDKIPRQTPENIAIMEGQDDRAGT